MRLSFLRLRFIAMGALLACACSEKHVPQVYPLELEGPSDADLASVRVVVGYRDVGMNQGTFPWTAGRAGRMRLDIELHNPLTGDVWVVVDAWTADNRAYIGGGAVVVTPDAEIPLIKVRLAPR
jgi:hypothetical protein